VARSRPDDRPRPEDRPESLPLLGGHRPGRPFTCGYRCGDACAQPPSNPVAGADDRERPTFTRRGALRAGALLSLTAAAGMSALSGPATPGARQGVAPPRGLDYRPVPVTSADAITVPPGYAAEVLIRWGDPVVPGAPVFDFEHQTAQAQARQFGYNCDFCGLLPIAGTTAERYVMIAGHEYTIEPLMFRGYDPDEPTEEQYRIALAAHGLTVVVLERDRGTGRLRVVLDDRLNRRHTATSEFALDGPAAGSPLLRTSADPSGTRVLGTLGNCAGGVTPWGTFLSAEENVGHYFANAAGIADRAVRRWAARYGFSAGRSKRRWERFDRRFDLAAEPNEAHRFGWVVEVDPIDPQAPPVKRTALGRCRHEGATVRLTADGRAAVYMGDDEAFEYVYKYVSDETMMPYGSRRAREHNSGLLARGTLSVARFTGDPRAGGPSGGTGEWVRLAAGARSYVEGMSAEEVYVLTREAADRVGATPMDRPEDIEANPHTGHVYLALTSNVGRGPSADRPDPRPLNRHGHVVELVEDGGDAAAERFTWSILLACGDPADPQTWFAGFDPSGVSPISSPDNLAFDPHGNLWISTDSRRELGINDGLYGVSLSGPTRGRTTLFAAVPFGAEAAGPVVTEEFVLLCAQHPGDVDGASPRAPASTWPDGPGTQPRPSVVAIRRVGEDGRPGRIGV